ncbi:hypothetical protein [Neorhizobium alkalisoli]|uniref:hypothetical protein n=1 Tax=Neorhizobium alkalisoli TaxID=528178 RepID=UPI000CF9E054|nr:hypothetical protein [Neorhizobium alkalisoli]
MTTVGNSMLGVTNTFALKLLRDAETQAAGTKARILEYPPLPAALIDDPGSGEVGEFIYDAFGKFANIPHLDDVIGLPAPSPQQVADSAISNHPSKLKFELKIGDVVLARIYESGVTELADGFDYSSIGFEDEAASLEGMALAQDRLDRILKFFAELAFDVTVFGPDGAPVVQKPDPDNATSEGVVDDPIMSPNKRLLSLMLEADRFENATDAAKDSVPRHPVDRKHTPKGMTEEEVAALSDDEYLALLKGSIAAMIDDRYTHLRDITLPASEFYFSALMAAPTIAG